MSTFPIGSVVIPALNEATTIRRCLDALLIGFAPGELDVVVSCNGCTDGTANIVRSSWPAVQVLEVTRASKPAALRAADQALSVFPRIYLDADVVLPATSARQILEYLRTGPALAARPPISYDTTDADAMVRSYYRARSRLFSLKRSLWGGGAYAVSAAGRARYDAYPEIIADDLFADKWFRRSEIEIIGSEPSVITVPRRVGDLFRVLRRKYLGNVQIQDLPEPPELTAQSTLRDLSAMVMSSPGAAVDAAVFLATVTAVRITLRLSPPAGWNRDESSRIPTTTLTLSPSVCLSDHGHRFGQPGESLPVQPAVGEIFPHVGRRDQFRVHHRVKRSPRVPPPGVAEWPSRSDISPGSQRQELHARKDPVWFYREIPVRGLYQVPRRE